MAYSQKKFNRGGGVSTLAWALDSSVSTGDLIVVTVSVYTGGAYTAVNGDITDTRSNSYTLAVQSAEFNGAFTCIWYTISGSSGACTVTYDPSPTGLYVAGDVSVYTGHAASPLDATHSATGNSTSPSVTDNASTAEANELVIAVCGVSASVPDVSIDTPATTGYTNLAVEQDSNGYIGYSGDYKYVTSTGTQSAAWGTLGSTYAWGAALATFKESASSGSGWRAAFARQANQSIG